MWLCNQSSQLSKSTFETIRTDFETCWHVATRVQKFLAVQTADQLFFWNTMRNRNSYIEFNLLYMLPVTIISTLNCCSGKNNLKPGKTYIGQALVKICKLYIFLDICEFFKLLQDVNYKHSCCVQGRQLQNQNCKLYASNQWHVIFVLTARITEFHCL